MNNVYEENGIMIDTENKTIVSLSYPIKDIRTVYSILLDITNNYDIDIPLIAITPWDYKLTDEWTITFPLDGYFLEGDIHIKMSKEDMKDRI